MWPSRSTSATPPCASTTRWRCCSPCFLSLLVLAFGLMAMRQMRLLGERQRALVDLTAHLREARRQAEAGQRGEERVPGQHEP